MDTKIIDLTKLQEVKENIDNYENFKNLIDALNEIAEKYDMPIIYSTHPRSFKKIEEKKIYSYHFKKYLK